MDQQPVWIDCQDALVALLAAIRRWPRFALDLEGDGYHRYPEHIALVQIALPDGSIYLLDPLALPELGGFADLLSDVRFTKVMHSADFDLRCLDRDYAIALRGLADTAIAAQLCGSERTGLAAVVEEYLGLRLDKPADVQRLDWARRPLPDHALRYAANDVAHLLALHDRLTARLDRLGRREWAREECRRLERVRYAPPDPPEESFRRIRGASKLSGHQLAALREMCIYRERAARELGRPPGRLLPDGLLLALAQGRSGIPSRGPTGAVASLWPGLLAARDRGQARTVPPLAPAGRATLWSEEARERLEVLKRWRRKEAARLGLAVGLVWPLVHLERLAHCPDRDLADLDDPDAPVVRQWQWGELGASLEAVRHDLRRQGEAGRLGTGHPAPPSRSAGQTDAAAARRSKREQSSPWRS